ncbi:phage tail protein [Tenacibaculum sp. Bg11-29]|uniref:phage tail protein n=1 Tax=Tenacibaculum sp. Bg11-29 TaxID=2058306 RepID=UPI000C33AE2B|nr:tail fiber protein [Tenacibaculum sp. Bg11-29]PKH52788.1 phage tail protein [Tenacibaculum sp. Bg11-29]
MDPFLGQIVLFGGNFAPRGWALCEGQLLPISQYSALFSILGTIYGGDGRTTFALPDLRGRAAISSGRGPGLSDRRLGSRSGQETHTLTIPEMPSHNHSAQGTVKVSSADSTKTAATADSSIATPGAQVGRGFTATMGFNDATPDISLNAPSNSVTVNNNGGNLAHNNMQPYLTTNYIIALQGVFPSRN